MVRFKKKKITNIIRKGKHQEGVNIVKVIKSAKVKVFSNDYIWHIVFLCWSIFLILVFFIPNL